MEIIEAVKAHLKANGMEMHQTCKGRQWHFGMKVHIGVDSESGLIHSVETTAANVHDLTPAPERLHDEESVVYADAGHQGIEKRSEMQGKGIGFRIAMRPGKRRALPDTPEGRVDDWIETALAGTASACGRHSSAPRWSIRSA